LQQSKLPILVAEMLATVRIIRIPLFICCN
jgi:hypothetical protein